MATVHTQLIDYAEGGTTLEGYLAHGVAHTGPRPAVLVAHTWAGRNVFAGQKAEEVAQLGYIGFAVDMYGKGILGTSPEECASLMTPLMEDRRLLRRRMLAALAAVRGLDVVDPDRVAAIGFCFGGLCVLDLARTGADVRGVVSVHGLLHQADGVATEPVRAKVLALHGHDDPMVPPEQIAGFEAEMTAAGADWQLHVYGNTMHAFTNPTANDPEAGTVYDEAADRRSAHAMRAFLEELFP